MPRVTHSAVYGFAAPTAGLVLDLRLAPAAWDEGRAAAALSAVPPPATIRRLLDRDGNRVDRLRFDRPLARLSLAMRIDLSGEPQPLPEVPSSAADLAPPAGAPTAPPQPSQPAPHDGHAAALAELAVLREGWTWARVDGGADAPLDDLLAARRGLCLELARLLVWRLRARGVPTRFVLGYALDRDRRGARERHAWIAVHDDGAGWREVDPTAPERPPAARLATAWGPVLASIVPVRARRPPEVAAARAAFSTQIDP